VRTHDNGSEFQGHFREACENLGLQQYHSRVKTPKDNATNERFNRTVREEFLEEGNAYDDPEVFNRHLALWLVEYNAHRPHQTLGYVTPMSFIQAHAKVTPTWSSSTAS
jgi:transposase InsO family protein